MEICYLFVRTWKVWIYRGWKALGRFGFTEDRRTVILDGNIGNMLELLNGELVNSN